MLKLCLFPHNFACFYVHFKRLESVRFFLVQKNHTFILKVWVKLNKTASKDISEESCDMKCKFLFKCIKIKTDFKL